MRMIVGTSIYALLFCVGLVFGLWAYGQQRPGEDQIRAGESALRQQARDLMLAVYRRADVTEACAKEPNGVFTVRLNHGSGAEVQVDCRARRAYLAYMEALEK